MECIEDMWKHFSLSDKEGVNVDLVNASQQSENILVAKFLTSRVLNIDSVARTFKPLWKTRHNFSVQDLGSNKVAFVFEDDMDLERVLINEPWSFDKSLVVFQRQREDVPSKDLVFSHVTFWVQIHNLPIRRMTTDSAETIGKTLGVVEKVADMDDERGGENCMRVRIRLNVTAPLCRGRMIQLEENKKCWVAFRYERLPNFCYWCGCLDHSEKDCDVGLRKGSINSTEERQYGPWLRASTERPPRKTAVMVHGSSSKEGSEFPRKDPGKQPAEQAADPHPVPPETSRESENPPENPAFYMEIEPNPGFTNQGQFPNPIPENFEARLHEIDQAINFFPLQESPAVNILPKVNSLMFSQENTPSASPLQHGPLLTNRLRGILEDISNNPRPNNSSPNPKTAKWKKLARAQHIISASTEHIQPLKRGIPEMEQQSSHGRKKRNTHSQNAYADVQATNGTLENDSIEILAEAGFQPCQQP